MEQPQPCTKCSNLPQDILMLACGHDLCLNCASERLNFELKKRKPANVYFILAQSIVCEFCYERTPLDVESISELEKLIPANSRVGGRSAMDSKPSSYDRSARVDEQQPSYPYRGRQTKEYDRGLSGSNSQMISGISSKKACHEHPDEDILYFCFTCKCECICPECVIHGKHKEHDVKTIRKSHPLVKNELQTSLDKIESSIENLLIRKSQVEKNIRTLTEQNSVSKRQIQQAFEEVRAKLEVQEREILAKCDTQLNNAVEQLEKSTKGLVKRIDELKSYSTATLDFIKKDEQTMLNFYAKKWKDINDQCKQQNISIQAVILPGNQKILTSILELTEQVDRVGGLPTNTTGRHDRY